MAYRKTKATEERKSLRRRALLDAATELFGKHGYHATTVPMIVACARTSTGSFYMYFRNKEDAFNSSLEELGRTIERLMQELKRSEPNIRKRMLKASETLFTFLAQNPEQARILIVDSSGLSPRLDRTRQAILLQQEEHVRQSLESDPCLFAVENTTIAARCIVGAAFEALYCWLQEDPDARMPAAEVARAVGRFNLQAVENDRISAFAVPDPLEFVPC